MPEILLTKKDAAAMLRVSTRTIDRLRARNELRFVPVGRQVRFTQDDLNAYVKRHAEGGEKGMGA